jgi:HlyD family secretion protein
MKYLLSKFSLLLAIAGIASSFFFLRFINKADPLPKAIAMPADNPFKNAIAASGIIESFDRNIAVGTPASGLIEKVFVKVDDQVKKGDPLFQIDTRDLRADLLVQKANVAISLANLKKQEDQLERLKSVQDPRAVSGEEVKNRQNDVAIADAERLAAESQVKQSELLIDRLIVKAPQGGTVLQSNIRDGEYVTAGSGAPPILLGNISTLQVRADIDEQNAFRFHFSARAFAYPKNNTALKIPLKFERVEPYVIPKRSLTGSSDERVDTRVLQVLYTFTRPKDFPVYIGQQVDVFIHCKSEDLP